jgi:hypothetical protein
MNRVSSGILAVLFLTMAHAIAGSNIPSKSAPKTYAARPSLDALVSRVDGYWNALLQKKKLQAAEYVAAADRDKFLSSNFTSFTSPHLKSLELSADRKEAIVTVVVNRTTPFGTRMEWPVTDKWRFEKGNWYRIPSAKPRVLLPGTDNEATASGGDAETLMNDVRKSLKIQNTVLDFGTVREFTPLKLSLKYTLAGKEPLGAAIEFPEGFAIEGGMDQVLYPGDHELRIDVPTGQLDGAVNERIIIKVHKQGATVPFDIQVKGNVYVPVSIAPKSVRFQKEESEKEIRIRNNSKSDLELLPVYSETRQVSIQPIPVTIPPGQEIGLKVKWSKGSPSLRTNYVDTLAIPFAKPVDGVNSLSLRVILNAPEARKDGEKAGAGEDFYLPSDNSRNCNATPDMK